MTMTEKPNPESLVEENERLRRQIHLLEQSNKRLIEDRERFRRTVDQQFERLNTMFNVASQIASSDDLEDVLPKLMNDAMRLTSAEAASLMLVDPETNDLVFKVALGAKGERIKPFRLSPGEGVAGWVAKEGKTLLCNDAQHDPRHDNQIDRLIGYHAKSILCSPLRAGGKVIGVVQVINKLAAADNAFDESDIPTFEAFADHAAVAIARTMAHQSELETFEAAMAAFAATLDARSEATAGKSQRVSDFAVAIGEELRMKPQDLADLRLAGLLHDIGYVAIPDAILYKRSELTAEEFEWIKRHPVIGWQIFSSIRQLRGALPGIRHHHERIDGAGYPDRLKGDEIPLQARILAVADCFDALTSNRLYRERIPAHEALEKMIAEGSGSQLDADLVDSLVAAFAKGRLRTQADREKTTKRAESAVNQV
jgi:HD-GYP domain-containing protein (c-di-GMP phosphodiesterase class II)